MTFTELKGSEAGLDKLVSILGAREMPPQLTLSPEVNVSGRQRKQGTIKIIEEQNALFSYYTVSRRQETAGKERNADEDRLQHQGLELADTVYDLVEGLSCFAGKRHPCVYPLRYCIHGRDGASHFVLNRSYHAPYLRGGVGCPLQPSQSARQILRCPMHFRPYRPRSVPSRSWPRRSAKLS